MLPGHGSALPPGPGQEQVSACALDSRPSWWPLEVGTNYSLVLWLHRAWPTVIHTILKTF